MTMMRDTEGDALPNNGPDDEHDNCWDINLWGDGELSLSIPMSFDAGDGGNYNGAGVVTVGLRELLQEYLDDCDTEVGVICRHVWLYAGNDVEICAKCNEIQDVQK
jgi:hypothetical protein